MTRFLDVSFSDWLQNPISLRLGSALLHFLWQGALIASVAMFLLMALRAATPRLRYNVLLSLFFLMAASPAITFCLLPSEAASVVADDQPIALLQPTQATRSQAPAWERTTQRLPPRLPDEPSTTIDSPSLSDPGISPAKPSLDPSLLASLATWCTHHRHWIVVTWLAGVAILSLRLSLGLFGVHLARSRRVTAASDHIQQIVARLTRQMRIRPAVQVLESALAEVPTLVGWLRPVVLLPASVISGLTTAELEAILAHELAHIRRHDYAINLLQTVVETILFYHPAIWWLSRLIRQEREHCCDDIAISVCHDRLTYARALASLEQLRPAPAYAIAATGGSLLHRIRRIVGQPEPRDSNKLALLAITAILALVITAGLPRQRPIKAQEKPATKNPATERAETEKPRTEEPADEKPTPEKQQPPIWRTYDFQIVNAKGEPVADATIKPWQVAYGRGSMGLGPDLEKPLKTDSQGKFKLIIPAEARFIKTVEEYGIRSFAFAVDHADYPVWSDYAPVEGTRQITLANPTTIEVKVRSESGETPRHLFPSPGTSDWSEKDGVVTIRRVDRASRNAPRWLRIVQAPPDSPPCFSELIDLNLHQGPTIRLETILKPGVSVAGRLADNAIRPITKGRALATIVSGGGAGDFRGWWWRTAVDIDPDGSFFFESLPAGDTVQLIAICDGWVSASTTAKEVEAYGTANGVAIEPRDDKRMVASNRVYPRLHRLTPPSIEPEIPMEATFACQVTVLDESDLPVPGARVSFAPNQYVFEGGSQLLGAEGDSLKDLRNPRDTTAAYTFVPPPNPYAQLTDAAGMALVSGLPFALSSAPTLERSFRFSVSHNDYVVPPDAPVVDRLPVPNFSVKIQPGQLGQITVKLKSKSASNPAPMP